MTFYRSPDQTSTSVVNSACDTEWRVTTLFGRWGRPRRMARLSWRVRGWLVTSAVWLLMVCPSPCQLWRRKTLTGYCGLAAGGLTSQSRTSLSANGPLTRAIILKHNQNYIAAITDLKCPPRIVISPGECSCSVFLRRAIHYYNPFSRRQHSLLRRMPCLGYDRDVRVSVGPSVCLSVCLCGMSHCCTVSKGRKLGSRNLYPQLC